MPPHEVAFLQDRTTGQWQAVELDARGAITWESLWVASEEAAERAALKRWDWLCAEGLE